MIIKPVEKLIKQGAEDPRRSTREVVEHLLSQFSHQELFDAIAEYMDDPLVGRLEWIICIKVLCRIDKEKANIKFLDVLQVEDADKRFRLIKLLGGACGTEVVVPNLTRMLRDDPEPGIRFMIASVLGEIGDKRALPALEWAADNDYEENHEEVSVSHAARKAIEKLSAP